MLLSHRNTKTLVRNSKDFANVIILTLPTLAFYRQSLQIQQLLSELFHNAYALRGIDGPEDVQHMYPFQRQLALDSLDIAQKCLTICVASSSYREGLKYGKRIGTFVNCLYLMVT